MGPMPTRNGAQNQPPPMVSSSPKEVFILGQTRDGRTFRPSDWAERLAGVMSSFRPGGAQPGSHLSYSPWCIPTVIDGVKAVVVNSELRGLEPMAWDFVLNFAKDNDLQVAEACLLPNPTSKP
jgi:hypothetical protein